MKTNRVRLDTQLKDLESILLLLPNAQPKQQQELLSRYNIRCLMLTEQGYTHVVDLYKNRIAKYYE